MSAPAPAPEETDDAIDEAFKIFGTLLSMKGELKNIGGNFYDDIEKMTEKIITKFKKDIANRTGKLLLKLYEYKPKKKTLKKLINQFPSSLEYKNRKKQLPIQSAVCTNAEDLRYVPLLAEQGVKYNVGGDDKRGGLLLGAPSDSDNTNVLQLLAGMRQDERNPIPFDTACLNTMKDLRGKKLLVKNDIKDHNLLYYACGTMTKLRFGYLANWSQDGLETHKCIRLPIFHSIIKYRPITTNAFPTFLEASLKHHTQDAGLLFQKDQHGKTACEHAFEKYGKDETFNMLIDLIPPDAPQFSILHHVMKHVPQYMDDFALRYPASMLTPDGLKTHKHGGLPIFHSIIKCSRITDGAFRTFLEASLKHHSQDAGLLFQKDKHSKTACERAFDKYGKEDTFNILTDLIPPDAPQFSILHHVMKHIPQYMDDFALRYPASMLTRDKFDRTVPHVEIQRNLASGTKTYRNNTTFFVRLGDEDLRRADPDRAGLYPFMVAASGNTSDLSAVNYLLRRDPSLASRKRKRRGEEDVIKIEQD